MERSGDIHQADLAGTAIAHTGTGDSNVQIGNVTFTVQESQLLVGRPGRKGHRRGSVRQPPAPGQTGRHHACGMLLATRPAPRPAGSAVQPETTAAARSGTPPTSGGQIVLRAETLRQRRQQRIPPLITDRRGLIVQERGLNVSRLPPVLFEETSTRASTAPCHQPTAPGGWPDLPASWRDSPSRSALRCMSVLRQCIRRRPPLTQDGDV